MAVTAITFAASSVSYAGSSASPPDHKATTIENSVISISPVSVFDLASVPLIAPDIVQDVKDENLIVEEKFAIATNSPTAEMKNRRCCTSDIKFIRNRKDITRSPGNNKAMRSQKFKDVHRRLCVFNIR